MQHLTHIVLKGIILFRFDFLRFADAKHLTHIFVLHLGCCYIYALCISLYDKTR